MQMTKRIAQVGNQLVNVLSAFAVAALVAATAPWQAHVVTQETGAPPRFPAGAPGYALLAALVTLVLALRLPAAALAPVLPLAVAGLPLITIDARCHRLPDRLTAPTLLAVTATAAGTSIITRMPGRLAAAVAGAAGMATFYALFLLATAVLGSGAAYGLGDIKLALPLGAALGWLGLVPWLAALLGAHLLYVTVHVTRALAGRTGWRERHAFGPPMLGAALLAALLVGTDY